MNCSEICAAIARFSDVGWADIAMTSYGLAIFRIRSLGAARRSTREAMSFSSPHIALCPSSAERD